MTDPVPRRAPYRTATIAGLALLAASLATAAPAPWEFVIELPQPGYRKADDSLLMFSQFKGTRIDWGTCMDEDRLLEVEDSHMVRSWGFNTRVWIPAGRDACIQAVIIGLNGDELGRSLPIRVSTTGPRKTPNSVLRLGAKQ